MSWELSIARRSGVEGRGEVVEAAAREGAGRGDEGVGVGALAAK
jgi:hypothetical protein